MAGGWSKDGAVQDQIDASIKDAIKQAKERIPKGESLTHCEECEAENLLWAPQKSPRK